MTSIELVALAAQARERSETMHAASALADETEFAPLHLARLGRQLHSDQLLALAVFHAGTVAEVEVLGVILHHALSGGRYPSHPVARLNALALMVRIAAELEATVSFLRSWAGWYIVDCLDFPDTRTEAAELLETITETRSAENFFDSESLREALRLAPKCGIRGSLDRAREDSGTPALLRTFRNWADRCGDEKSVEFAHFLCAEVEREEVRVRSPSSTASTTMAEIAWTAAERALTAAAALLAALIEQTRRQDVSNASFATGSFIVQFDATGRETDLPDVDAEAGAGRSITPHLRGLLAMVMNGQAVVTIRQFPARSARPKAWCPTQEQASRLLALQPVSQGGAEWRTVVLLSVDPYASTTGLIRFRYPGETDVRPGSLLDRRIVSGATVDREYRALIATSQANGVESVEVRELRPCEDKPPVTETILRSSELPRVSNLARLAQFVGLIAERGGAELVEPHDFGVEDRTTIAYWVHFARCVGAVDSRGLVTDRARPALASSDRTDAMRALFVTSRLATELLAFSGVGRLNEVSRRDIERFVEQRVTGVRRTTLTQRVNALTRLVRDAQPAHTARKSPSPKQP